MCEPLSISENSSIGMPSPHVEACTRASQRSFASAFSVRVVDIPTTLCSRRMECFPPMGISSDGFEFVRPQIAANSQRRYRRRQEPQCQRLATTIRNGFLSACRFLILIGLMLGLPNRESRTSRAQEPALTPGAHPATVTNDLRSLKKGLSEIRCVGSFTTKTFSEGWAIHSAGQFSALNSQSRLLTKSELDQFHFNGAPPDYLREVAMRCSTLRTEAESSLSRALFGFRRATPAVKFDFNNTLLTNPAVHWNHLRIDHGHIVPAFAEETDASILAALLIPEAAIHLLETSASQEGNKLSSTQQITGDQQHKVVFEWLDRSPPSDETTTTNLQEKPPVAWQLTLQSLHPESQFVRLESVSQWSQTPNLQWTPRSLRTSFHHSSSWNWEIAVEFDNVTTPSNIPATEFDLTKMMFEPITFTETDTPQVKKTYDLLKQLHGIRKK